MVGHTEEGTLKEKHTESGTLGLVDHRTLTRGGDGAGRDPRDGQGLRGPGRHLPGRIHPLRM